MLVDGERFPIWYRSSVPLSFDRCDALVPIGLLAAMRARTSLRLPGPVSARLLANLEDVQDILGAFSRGELASGQVVGVIDDLPTCEELIDRVVTQAAAELRRSQGYLV